MGELLHHVCISNMTVANNKWLSLMGLKFVCWSEEEKRDGRAPPETKQDRYPTVPQNLSRGLEDISEPYTFRGFSDPAA